MPRIRMDKETENWSGLELLTDESSVFFVASHILNTRQILPFKINRKLMEFSGVVVAFGL